ncbi:MAG: sugar phosphate isomerase/epimerase family protein [Phycisphaerales bacterium JB060]
MFQQGSNPPLGLGLCAWRDRPVREAVALAASLGYRAVQLDATHAEARPRSLDRSARRDLGALLRRHELELTGLDLWLPPEHLATGQHVERAAEAVVGAIGLVRELSGLVPARVVVSLTLPDEPDPHAMQAINAAAERVGVAIANHAWPAAESGDAGIDPALAIMAGASPAKAVTTLGARLKAARLSDAGGAGRVAVGSPNGRLEVSAFAAALAISSPTTPVVADARQLPDPIAGARLALEAWADAAAFPGS